MFRFENTEYLLLLWLLVFFVLLFIIYAFVRKRNIKKFGDLSLVEKLMPETSFKRKVLKFTLMSLAFVSAVLALARPQYGTEMKEVKKEGVELAIAIDVSNSMLARDITPNRLQNTLVFVQRVIRRLKDDKIALIVFAGDAFIQLPMTDDLNAARMFLPVINTDIVPVQGTAIASALEMSARTFTADPDVSKIILVITDGENHEEDPVSVTENLAGQGITIHTIGMGLPGGAPIPLQNGRGFLRDQNGNVVTTALDEHTLKAIAAAGSGIYVRASNNPNSLDVIIEEIEKAQTGEIIKTEYSEYEEQFQYFVGLSILLLIINSFVSERKNRLLSKMNIFKT